MSAKRPAYIRGMTHSATITEREAARHRNGQFGEQTHTAPEMTLDAAGKTAAAVALAEELLTENGLTGWRVTVDNAGRRLGICRPGRKTISLSRQYIAVTSDDVTQDTIRHEVAHALAGASEGHGPVWQDHARALGADPTATADVPEMRDTRARRLEDVAYASRHPYGVGAPIPDGTEVVIIRGQQYLQGMRATILSRAVSRYLVETEDGQQFRAGREFFGRVPTS